MRLALRSLPVDRDLPWRATRDPWRILIAELCCQQTQAARAVAAYERCCERFPTPEACADAPLADVLSAWKGLGYYRRARALHEAARQIVDLHDGQVPCDLAALRALPGVGPYTARAVLAFAFEVDVGVVDTNVARVLSRAVAGRALSASEAQRLADDAVDPGRGWAHNQALLDLGASTCGPVPRCAHCPLARSCRWRRAGRPLPDPAKATAGVSRPQATFVGSDREGRGRLIARLLDGPVRSSELAAVMGWPSDVDRASRVADTLVRDRLAQRQGTTYRATGSQPPLGGGGAQPGLGGADPRR
jgi:A/G-specific adenine glycosylase